MWGIQLAFREFDPTKGLTGGKFVGLKYFNEFFRRYPLFGEIIINTVPTSPCRRWSWASSSRSTYVALLINQIGFEDRRASCYDHHRSMPHFISMWWSSSRC